LFHLLFSQLLWLIYPLDDEPFPNDLAPGTISCGNTVVGNTQTSNIANGKKTLLLLLDLEKFLPLLTFNKFVHS
jgi:hypothetical protein